MFIDLKFSIVPANGATVYWPAGPCRPGPGSASWPIDFQDGDPEHHLELSGDVQQIHGVRRKQRFVVVIMMRAGVGWSIRGMLDTRQQLGAALDYLHNLGRFVRVAGLPCDQQVVADELQLNMTAGKRFVDHLFQLAVRLAIGQDRTA